MYIKGSHLYVTWHGICNQDQKFDQQKIIVLSLGPLLPKLLIT